MKITILLVLSFFFLSCSQDTNPSPSELKDNNDQTKALDYQPNGVPLSNPQVEVMEVSQTEISLNWFNPSNWQSIPEYPNQPEFLVEASTNPKFDNLVTSRRISDSYQTTFSNLQPDLPHHFRVRALPSSGDIRYLKGEPTTITVMTGSYPKEQVGSFAVNPEFGKVHFSWSQLVQPGPIDYVIHLLDSPEQQKPFREFITRENEIRDVILQGGRTYWAQFRASPAEDNNAFSTTDEITVQFDMPGNPLPKLENITGIDRNGTLEIQWSPVTKNLGEFSYMINVKSGENTDQPFGDYVQKEALLRIPNAKPYGRFSFQIKSFPDAENYIDLESISSVFIFDFPLVYCTTPAVMPISRPDSDPSDLKISFAKSPDAPLGHRYEIEVASDQEFSIGLDRRTIEGVELSTVMTGRLEEENHYVRIRMIGPENDATFIASSWTDTIFIEAQPRPVTPPNPLP